MLGPIGLAAGASLASLVLWLSRRRFSPGVELRRAVRNREFVLLYQPLVELATGACVGAEALVRWRRADGRIVPPLDFIPLAESNGLIRPITEQVIERALTELGPMLRRRRDLHVSINLAPMDLQDPWIAQCLDQLLADSGVEPHQVTVETTERGMVDADAAREVIKGLRSRGHGVAIDDFGTGYSSLSYLQSLEVDTLKIDKTFIDALGLETATSSVVPHIVEMARTLRLRVVAEGVETDAQVKFLREQAVDYAQGWLFSKPLTCDAFGEFVRKSPIAAATANFELAL